MNDAVEFDGEGLAASRGGLPVFSGLAFAVPRGGALRLMGPNGGGKTTLLRLMAGLGRPASGTVRWRGTAIDDDRDGHADRVAFLGHTDALKPSLSGRANISSMLAIAGRPLDRLDAALAALDLTSLAQLPVGWLSSGQRRRMALARVIASGAPLWLLDEPTVGLDAVSTAALERVIAAHRQAGGLVVAATHVALDLGPGTAELDPARFAAGAAA